MVQVSGERDRNRAGADEDEVDQALCEYQYVTNFSTVRLHWGLPSFLWS
jgi:hypothetical protein